MWRRSRAERSTSLAPTWARTPAVLLGLLLVLVAFAFADSSIMVLALPDLLRQFRPTVTEAGWVITSYNITLALVALAVLLLARRPSSRALWKLGLVLFLVASIACGSADGFWTIVAWRSVQGVGGGLLLIAALPLLRSLTTPARGTALWAAAGAIGVVVGPAAGGFLTDFLDWRFIFFAQVPVTLLALVVAGGLPDEPGIALGGGTTSDRRERRLRLQANLGLVLASAALVGTLFLAVLLLIDGWRMRPISAAAIVCVYPIAAVIVQPLARRESPARVALGAVLLSAGLAGMALVHGKDILWAIGSLFVAGLGTGLVVSPLARAALGEELDPRNAVRTVSARQVGLIAGLLILTPMLSGDVTSTVNSVQNQVSSEFLASSLPLPMKIGIGAAVAPLANRPLDMLPKFVSLLRESPDPDARAFGTHVDKLIRSRVTGAFRRSFWVASLFALLICPLVVLRLRSQRLGTGLSHRGAGTSTPPRQDV
jgi:MFS family permease